MNKGLLKMNIPSPENLICPMELKFTLETLISRWNEDVILLASVMDFLIKKQFLNSLNINLKKI